MLLLSANASPNGNSTHRPLNVAAMNRDAKSVKLLLDAKADCSLTDKDGRNAVEAAKINSPSTACLQMLQPGYVPPTAASSSGGKKRERSAYEEGGLDESQYSTWGCVDDHQNDDMD